MSDEPPRHSATVQRMARYWAVAAQGFFLLVGLVELITEIEDLTIGLGFSLIATEDADDLLCQFGSIGLLSLSKQRRRRNNQNPQDQQPVHKFPRDPQATIP